MQSITVHAPGEVFQKPISVSGETEILGLETPPEQAAAAAAARPRTACRPPPPTAGSCSSAGIQTFSWKADDPNGDTLLYDVHYRRASDTRFRLLRKGLTEPVLAWDTSTVPNGRYVVRVTASDAPSNPAALALAGGQGERCPSTSTTRPPRVTVTARGGATACASVPPRATTAASSAARSTRWTAGAGRRSTRMDGINDAREETYELLLPELTGPSPHSWWCGSSTRSATSSTGRVEVP